METGDSPKPATITNIREAVWGGFDYPGECVDTRPKTPTHLDPPLILIPYLLFDLNISISRDD
jgi:hypothetical protein